MNDPEHLAGSVDAATADPSTDEPAPVVLFAYSRPDHLRRTVESLLRNPECGRTHLHVFCDGPKSPEHQLAVNTVRRYVDSVCGFASVSRVYRQQNLGLAQSVIEGVTQVVGQHGRVIVLEDDLVLSPHFLAYMNAGLACYADDAEVASIHGYCYPTQQPLPETFFLKGADCWGWATWQRAWQHFEPNGQMLLDELLARDLSRRFDYNGQFPFTQMLEDQIAGRNSSWAIRWHAFCFLKGLLTLYPGRSLVHNAGFDSSGRHCDTRSDFDQHVSTSPVTVERLALCESQDAWQAFESFYKRQRPPVHRRAMAGLKRRLAHTMAPYLSREGT